MDKLIVFVCTFLVFAVFSRKLFTLVLAFLFRRRLFLNLVFTTTTSSSSSGASGASTYGIGSSSFDLSEQLDSEDSTGPSTVPSASAI